MNILEKLIPSLNKEQKEVLAKEEQAAAEKADRIAFHRAKVRNGPVRFTTLTNGQLRRAQKRSEATAQRKNFKAQKRAFFAAQYEASVLRAHLQRLGVVEYATPVISTPTKIEGSIAWIFANFHSGATTFSEDQLQVALQKAYDRYAYLTGQPAKQVELNGVSA